MLLRPSRGRGAGSMKTANLGDHVALRLAHLRRRIGHACSPGHPSTSSRRAPRARASAEVRYIGDRMPATRSPRSEMLDPHARTTRRLGTIALVFIGGPSALLVT